MRARDNHATAQDLYRLQFLIGPQQPDGYPGWHHVPVAADCHLLAHPSLNIDRLDSGGMSLILLGYMLDPARPRAGNAEILERLLSALSGEAGLFGAIEPLGGRWALIVKDAHGLRLVNDATGLRQVFHTRRGDSGAVWCASQPGHIAAATGLEEDEAATGFIHWMQSRDPEYWWPGTSSPYRQVRRLLPNHWLDLESGEAHRFWPVGSLPERTVDEAIDRVSGLLTGLMQGAARRSELALAISAGWDSRLMLAASRSIGGNVRCYTAKRPDMDWRHMDVEIPLKLLETLGLKHDVIEHGTAVSPEFEQLFNGHVPYAHPMRLEALQSELDHYQRGRVGVTGNISEVARCFYAPPDGGEAALDAGYLARVTGMEHPFAREHFERWLSDLDDPFNYDMLDLFYWEQRTGSWFAHNCLEFDTAWQELFLPFNNRRLLMELLAVDREYRGGPDYPLYRKLIEHLWPEVLAEPINPRPRHSRLKRLLGRLARVAGAGRRR